jgi:hypothetical protein
MHTNESVTIRIPRLCPFASLEKNQAAGVENPSLCGNTIAPVFLRNYFNSIEQARHEAILERPRRFEASITNFEASMDMQGLHLPSEQFA